MSVKLVSITQPRIEGVNTAEELIAYCARVSNPANQFNTETSSKLLKYLVKNKHWSPFEMVSVCIEIETTRDIGRQILRHRSFSFQEFSQRYSSEIEFENRELRLQDTKNRQNSIEVEDYNLNSLWKEMQDEVLQICERNYNWALSKGIAKEQARCLLPEGLTLSKMYMQGSLRSWITYIALREKNGTQKEHREIALECKSLILNEFPVLKECLGSVDIPWVI